MQEVDVTNEIDVFYSDIQWQSIAQTRDLPSANFLSQLNLLQLGGR